MHDALFFSAFYLKYRHPNTEHPLCGFHLLVQKFAEASFDGSIASPSANR